MLAGSARSRSRPGARGRSSRCVAASARPSYETPGYPARVRPPPCPGCWHGALARPPRETTGTASPGSRHGAPDCTGSDRRARAARRRCADSHRGGAPPLPPTATSSRQIAVPPVEFDFFPRQHSYSRRSDYVNLNACLGGTGNITNVVCEEPSCGAPRTHGRTSATRMSRVERTIQLAATGDRLNSSAAPVFTNTPEFWPVPASESGPQLRAQ